MDRRSSAFSVYPTAMVRTLALGAVLLAIGCKSGAGSSDDPELQVTAEPSKGSAGGFSANLGAELGMEKGDRPHLSPAAGSGSASGSGAAPASSGVAVSAEIAAIKLTLMPGWERDAGEGGTISRFVRVERTGQSALFKFHYGYEDARAPEDRAAYKKFLTESQILRVLNDRQRGTAWLLEGKDATGGQAFRMVVLYGGKRLVCWGSDYKGSSLGDVRDEVVIQARKICESISL